MIRVQALDLILEQDTLNRAAQEWMPKTESIRSLSLELTPGLIRLHIDGRMPIIGDRAMTAELTVTLQGNDLWMKLERTNIPIIPKPAIVGMVVSLAKQDALRSEGSNLVLDLSRLFAKYEVKTHVQNVVVEQDYVRLICLVD